LLYLALFLTFDIEKNTATLKSSSGVTEGHRRWYHSITWLWLLISVIRPIVVTLSLSTSTLTLKPVLGIKLFASLHQKHGTRYLFTIVNTKHTLVSDVITHYLQSAYPAPSSPNAP